MPQTDPHHLVITIGTTGDLHPFLHVAQALQTLGRKVTFITHAHYRNIVQDAGLPFVGIGTEEEFLRALKNPDIWDPRKGFAALLADYSNGLQQIIDAIQSASVPAVQAVIAHPFAVSGAVIARELGMADSVVGAYLAPSNLRTCHDPLTIGDISVPRWVPMSWRRALWRFIDKGWIDPVAMAHLNAVRTARGLSKVDSFLPHIAEAPNLSVTLFPSWFAPVVPDWPRPLIEGDFQLFEAATQQGFSTELSAFLAAGEKPFVFTPGTGNLHAAKFFAYALTTINRLGRRAIFLTKEQAQVPSSLPASVLWQPYVPLSALLPHAAALIHHGGIGTTAEALRSGTPQLIVPFAWDQFDNGARITSLGVGMAIPAKKLQSRKLAHALSQLHNSDSIRTQCALLASRFAAHHDPIALCREIEQLALATCNEARHPNPPDFRRAALASQAHIGDTGGFE